MVRIGYRGGGGDGVRSGALMVRLVVFRGEMEMES